MGIIGSHVDLTSVFRTHQASDEPEGGISGEKRIINIYEAWTRRIGPRGSRRPAAELPIRQLVVGSQRARN
jgi:hypothetical protein